MQFKNGSGSKFSKVVIEAFPGYWSDVIYRAPMQLLDTSVTFSVPLQLIAAYIQIHVTYWIHSQIVQLCGFIPSICLTDIIYTLQAFILKEMHSSGDICGLYLSQKQFF
ncbi:Hypothetical_protein [Hexamita inflata]|uniref:Hypothetical_protein n=1 Tax=Hexamita inflata TaxID=28002 RepID=A0AA86RAT7_9EUKA|nr:Hypothetical protein HINF_LOCUS58181 [Hexamita inflata]